MSSPSIQRNLPPMEVTPLNRALETRLTPDRRTVKPVNLLRITRDALQRSGLSQRWFAAAIGISEPLVSAQLSDHVDDKHLSARRLGRVDDFGFWREFLLLLAEDLGLTVVILDAEQRAVLTDLQATSANFARVMSR